MAAKGVEGPDAKSMEPTRILAPAGKQVIERKIRCTPPPPTPHPLKLHSSTPQASQPSSSTAPPQALTSRKGWHKLEPNRTSQGESHPLNTSQEASAFNRVTALTSLPHAKCIARCTAMHVYSDLLPCGTDMTSHAATPLQPPERQLTFASHGNEETLR